MGEHKLSFSHIEFWFLRSSVQSRVEYIGGVPGRKNWPRDTDLGISNIYMKTEAMG